MVIIYYSCDLMLLTTYIGGNHACHCVNFVVITQTNLSGLKSIGNTQNLICVLNATTKTHLEVFYFQG